MKVQLTTYEILTGAQVGIMRQAQNLKDRPNADAHGASVTDGWQLHVEGALGEMAFAKALGVYWNGNIGALKAGDVGFFEVRTTSNSTGRLILHPTDKDNSFYVLMIGVNGLYHAKGFIRGTAGKKPEYWEDPTGQGRPAFFVPWHALHPIEHIQRMLKKPELEHVTP